MFTDDVYGTRRGQGNNNCYGWAIDEYRDDGGRKLQPGNLSDTALESLASCDQLRDRALADLRGAAYAVDAGQACRKGYYKVMSFLDPGDDYHWYKQHRHALVRLTPETPTPAAVAKALGVPLRAVYSPSSAPGPGDMVLVKHANVWSHKQGFATGPLLRDACGTVIKDPRSACRTYGSLDYTRYCGALCVMARNGRQAAREAAAAAVARRSAAGPRTGR